jgi:glycosyltransferase involved in cell wall biosynthesis
MAAGVPVAVARTASLPEICGDAALYFDPLNVGDIAEKLTEIISDSQTRTELRARGLSRSRLLSWDACSRTTAEALRAVLAR